jgi:hypothetical protein
MYTTIMQLPASCQGCQACVTDANPLVSNEGKVTTLSVVRGTTECFEALVKREEEIKAALAAKEGEPDEVNGTPV